MIWHQAELLLCLEVGICYFAVLAEKGPIAVGWLTAYEEFGTMAMAQGWPPLFRQAQ